MTCLVELNPNSLISMVKVGQEQTPLLIVDDFIAEPKSLIDYAESHAVFAPTDDFYPGVKAGTPPAYGQQVVQQCAALLAEVFTGQRNQALTSIEHSFAMATAKTESLLPIQCIPHFDAADGQQLAMVHYLCDSRFGGTAFYRHKQTGFERILRERQERYCSVLGSQATSVGLPQQDYINGSTDLFEQIYSVEAKFNRAVIYPAALLHSGNVSNMARHTAPRQGRLTITSAVAFASA